MRRQRAPHFTSIKPRANVCCLCGTDVSQYTSTRQAFFGRGKGAPDDDRSAAGCVAVKTKTKTKNTGGTRIKTYRQNGRAIGCSRDVGWGALRVWLIGFMVGTTPGAERRVLYTAGECCVVPLLRAPVRWDYYRYIYRNTRYMWGRGVVYFRGRSSKVHVVSGPVPALGTQSLYCGVR